MGNNNFDIECDRLLPNFPNPLLAFGGIKVNYELIEKILRILANPFKKEGAYEELIEETGFPVTLPFGAGGKGALFLHAQDNGRLREIVFYLWLLDYGGFIKGGIVWGRKDEEGFVGLRDLRLYGKTKITKKGKKLLEWLTFFHAMLVDGFHLDKKRVETELQLENEKQGKKNDKRKNPD